MNYFATCLILTEIFLLAACGQAQEARDTYNAMASSARAVKKMGPALEQAQQRQQARAARGDTLALSYHDLQRYLPGSIAGFRPAGEPKGESVHLNGISYSSCEQTYTNGDQRLKVQLIDYSAAAALYTSATALMSAGFAQENEEQRMRGCDLGVAGIKGWEILQKKEGKASVALGVGDRFFVAIESDGQQDTEFVKQVARTLDLQGLARL